MHFDMSRVQRFVFAVEVGDEQESEESGEEEGEEEGTESDLVRPAITTQPNYLGAFDLTSRHLFWVKTEEFEKSSLYTSASEHGVQSEEEVEKENKERRRVAQAVQETEEEDKGQRWPLLLSHPHLYTLIQLLTCGPLMSICFYWLKM